MTEFSKANPTNKNGERQTDKVRGEGGREGVKETAFGNEMQ